MSKTYPHMTIAQVQRNQYGPRWTCIVCDEPQRDSPLTKTVGYFFDGERVCRDCVEAHRGENGELGRDIEFMSIRAKLA